MIIDRQAAVTPTRYDGRELRRWMGGQISAAGPDDLLAAWLWTEEARLCRSTAEEWKDHCGVVARERAEVHRQAEAHWRDRPGDRIPTAHRDRVQDALERAALEFGELASAAARDGSDAGLAWSRMRCSFGKDPVESYQGREDRDRSPVQASFRHRVQLTRSREALTRVLAALREAVQAAAVEEDVRRQRIASGDLSPEEQFLRGVHAAAHIHRDRVEQEADQLELREAAGDGPTVVYNAAQHYVNDWSAALALAHSIRAERKITHALVEQVNDHWEVLTADARPDGRGLAPGIPGESVALFGTLAVLSREVASARERVDAAVEQHAEALHHFGLRRNRRHDWDRSERYRSLDQIGKMHYREFEHLVADLLVRDSFSVEQRGGGPNDQGADVIATCPTGQRFVVQCKHTSVNARVGTPDLQRFKGTAWDVHRADVALVVTNSDFSKNAEAFAAEHNLQLAGDTVMWRWAYLGDPLLDIRPGLAEGGRTAGRGR
ncbi:restriction endonuclease [Kitasatospora sp. NPDC088134]|uniref:restriction endonuclease n=1 Tax=Kitasatospora sp. NPDC088134 TaxID=3364071 RepID=UPI00381BEEEC